MWPEPSGPGESLEVSACVRVHSCVIGFVPLCTCVCLACLLQDSMRTRGAACSCVCVYRWESVMVWGDGHVCESTVCTRAMCMC